MTLINFTTSACSPQRGSRRSQHRRPTRQRSLLAGALAVTTLLAVSIPASPARASLPTPDGEQVDLSDPSVRTLVPVPAGALAALNPGSGSGSGAGAVTTPAPSGPATVTTPVVIPTPGQRLRLPVQTAAGPVSLDFGGARTQGTAAPQVTVTVVPSPPVGEATRGLLGVSPRIRVQAPAVAFESVEICVPFDRAALITAGHSLERFRLLHFTGNREIDITTRITLSGTRWQICGEATSFSEFQGSVLAGNRLAGANRYGTAAAIAAEVAPNGASTVFIASGETHVDGLVAGLAAKEAGAPLLLVRRDGVPAETLTALTSLKPTSIRIIGGTAAVSAAVASRLATHTGARITRTGGANRYATAASVMRSTYPSGVRTVYLVSGESFADALGAGAISARSDAAMLLTSRTSLPESTRQALTAMTPERIIVVGGTAAIDAAVLTQAAAYGTVQRVGGTDRYATAALLAGRFGTTNTVVAVTGRDFADGIVATTLAGARNAPILLVDGDRVPAATRERLRLLGAEDLRVLGGRTAVGTQAELTLVRNLTPGAPQAL